MQTDKIKDLKVGTYMATSWGKGKNVPAIFVRRIAENEYKLEYVAPLPECHNEDPGSVRCGCPMQGKSHGHAEKIFASVDEIREAEIEAEKQIDAGHVPTFADLKRVGA